jgi:hypothetical protein
LAADTSWGMHLGSATSSATQYRSRGAFIRC